MRKSKQERFPYFRLLFGIQCCKAIESSNLRMQQALWLMVHTNRSNIKIFIIYKTKKKTPTLLRFLQNEASRVCNVNEKHQCNPCIAKWIAGRMKSQAEENVMKIFDIQPAGRQANGRTNERECSTYAFCLACCASNNAWANEKLQISYKTSTNTVISSFWYLFRLHCPSVMRRISCVHIEQYLCSFGVFSISLSLFVCVGWFFFHLHSCWLYFALNLQLKAVCVRDQTNQHLQVQKTNRNVYVVNIRAK